MNDAQIAAAVEVVVTVVRQDQCADGYHDYDYRPQYDGRRRCSCGAMHPDDLAGMS